MNGSVVLFVEMVPIAGSMVLSRMRAYHWKIPTTCWMWWLFSFVSGDCNVVSGAICCLVPYLGSTKKCGECCGFRRVGCLSFSSALGM